VGLVLFVFLLPVCVVVTYRRRGTGKPLLVPLALLVYSNVAAILFLVTVVHVFSSIARLPDPSSKAALLAMGISQMMNATVFGFVVNVPLMIGGYFVDRRLMRRALARSR
jgi:hypothetical protein